MNLLALKGGVLNPTANKPAVLERKEIITVRRQEAACA